MRSCRSGFVLLALLALAARGDDFGFDEEEPVAPADPWAGVTQLFPDPATQAGKGFGEGRSPSPSLELVGEFDLPDSAPEGLSGIAWTHRPDVFGKPGNYGNLLPDGFDAFGPDAYALCEDSGGTVHWAEIAVDRTDGSVSSVVFRATTHPAPPSADLEGIACRKTRGGLRNALYLADESAPSIHLRQLSPSGDYAAGAWVRELPLPAPLRSHRGNKGVEAMALSPDERILWVANEDALPEDGPVATTERGSRVRLYAMDASTTASPPESADPPWWFYELDPATGTSFPHLPAPFNGLAELCALPDGRLLALERSYGFLTRGAADPRGSLIAISIYLIDPLASKPADPSGPPGPSGIPDVHHAEDAEPPSAARTAAAPRPPVLAKTLLWRGLTGRSNYEGMTLGPALADGSRALLLVADGDVTRKGSFSFPWRKSLLSFRLRLP